MKATGWLTCLCGHMHGAQHCEAVVDGLTCSCTRMRRGRKIRIWNFKAGRYEMRPDISDGNTATSAPGFHFEAYGIQNPFVQEAIRRGAYWDIEPAEPSDADALDRESRWVAAQLGLI